MIDKNRIKKAILCATNNGKIHPDTVFCWYFYNKDKIFDTKEDEVYAFTILAKIWTPENPKLATEKWIEYI